eukprot:1250752-Prorocentrum_lima.AAC.1
MKKHISASRRPAQLQSFQQLFYVDGVTAKPTFQKWQPVGQRDPYDGDTPRSSVALKCFAST